MAPRVRKTFVIKSDTEDELDVNDASYSKNEKTPDSKNKMSEAMSDSRRDIDCSEPVTYHRENEDVLHCK